MQGLPARVSGHPVPSDDLALASQSPGGASVCGGAPGEAIARITLRALPGERTDGLAMRAETEARQATGICGLGCRIAFDGVAPAEGQPPQPARESRRSDGSAPAAMSVLEFRVGKPPRHLGLDFPDAPATDAAGIFGKLPERALG